MSKKKKGTFASEEFKILWDTIKFIWVIPLVGFLLVKVAKIDFADLGPFGDFTSGTLVPILTFGSFLAIVITLKMQKEQLEMQRIELKNSIDEMKATREEFIEQNKTLSVQRFENTFFQMVSLHNEIVKSLFYSSLNPEKSSGRNSFSYFYQDLKNEYTKKLNNHEFNGKDEITRIRIAYVSFFNESEYQLGHYFRNLYRIIKFIDQSEIIDLQDKKTYIGIIKAQLSSYELALLFYNGLSIVGNNFLHQMHKYNLLDNLNANVLILRESHMEEYKQLTDLIK